MPAPFCAHAAEHPDAYWDQVMEINVDAQFVLGREVGRDMLARARGKIIFTASLLTFQGGINVPGYAASKGAIGSLPKPWPTSGPAKG
jgi:2-deoxy-D-gluconate 3-dehydrogenase